MPLQETIAQEADETENREKRKSLKSLKWERRKKYILFLQVCQCKFVDIIDEFPRNPGVVYAASSTMLLPLDR
jgi:hypothetical protein